MTAESSSQPAAQSDDLDTASMAAIRALLAEDDAPARKRGPRRIARKAEADPIDANAEIAPRSMGPVTEAPQETPEAASAPAHERASVGGLKAKLLGCRPTPRHVIWGGLALLVVFRPWLVLGIVLLSAFILTGIFLILGYDGFWRRVMGIARWHARRHPSRSAEIHRKLDTFAMRFDAFLDRFPEGTVDGLYLPDFGALADADTRHDAALDRRFETLRDT